MSAGKRDVRIVLQRATRATDAFNALILTWNALATVWAEYSHVSDGEKARAGEVSSDIMARFTVRYSVSINTIDTRDQILFDGRTWDIRGVKEIGRNVDLEITAVARGERV